MVDGKVSWILTQFSQRVQKVEVIKAKLKNQDNRSSPEEVRRELGSVRKLYPKENYCAEAVSYISVIYSFGHRYRYKACETDTRG